VDEKGMDAFMELSGVSHKGVFEYDVDECMCGWS
jgi:hypothetical protein